MNKLQLILKGIVKENPTFVLVLGMCPTLGTTTSAANGFGMGVATMAVLILSNIVISLIKNFIPDKVRIPAFIVVIASFVTIVQMLMQAFVPALYATLGVFIPLIVVNCIILGRAEAFASKNNAFDSALDGLGIGLGFTLSLTVIGTIRELLGSGAVFGYSLGTADYMPLVFVLAPGGFLVLGYLMVVFNKLANGADNILCNRHRSHLRQQRRVGSVPRHLPLPGRILQGRDFDGHGSGRNLRHGAHGARGVVDPDLYP